MNSNLKNEKIIISNPEKITWIQFFDFFDSLFPSERVIYEDSSKIQKNLSNPLKLLKVILGDPKKAFMWEPMKSFLMNLKNHLTPKMKNQIKEIYSFYKRFSPSPIFYPDSMLMDVYLDKSELDLDKMKAMTNQDIQEQKLEQAENLAGLRAGVSLAKQQMADASKIHDFGRNFPKKKV